MTFATTLVSQASKQIAKYGKTLTFVRVTPGTYDRTTATVTNSEVSSTIKGIVEGYKAWDIGNGLAEKGDLKVSVPALDFTAPTVSDKLTIDAKSYRIVQVDTVFAGELAALYTIQARAA